MRRISQVFIVIKALESMSIGWVFGTYVLFLLEHGLTLFHANLLNLSFMTACFLFDPFTGHLADRVGQKKVYVWGQVVLGLGTLIYGLGRTFQVFLLAELTAAIGAALMSEAMESWLRNNTNEVVSHKVISRTYAVSSLATIPSAIAGGIIGRAFGLHWPWLMAALCFGLSVSLTYVFFRHLSEGQPKNEARETLPGILEIARRIWRSPPLRFTVVIALVSTAAFQPLNMFWAPVLRDASGSAWWLGSMWVGIAIASAFGAFLANKWLKHNGLEIALTLLLIGSPLLAITLLSPAWPLLVTGFLAHEVGRGVLKPLLFTYSNRYIDDLTRSTTNSIRSACGTFGAAIGLLVSGLLTLALSPLAIWGLSAIALILGALYAYKRKE